MSERNAGGIQKRRWLFLPLLICLIFGVTLYFSLDNDPHSLSLVKQDKPFPAFSAQNLFDAHNSLTNPDLSGDVILVNVWASWCGTCKVEHEFLMNLANRPELSLYGLNYRDSREAAINVLNKTGNPYKNVIFDPDGKLALELGVYGTPETYLLDENNVIRLRYSGELNEESWQAIFVPEIAAIAQRKGS